MSDSLERTVEELRVKIARLEDRIGILERREVRVGGSLTKLSGFENAKKADATTDEMPVMQQPSESPVAPPVPGVLPPPSPAAATAKASPTAPPPVRNAESAREMAGAVASTGAAAPPPFFNAEVSLSRRGTGQTGEAYASADPASRAAVERDDLESKMGLTWINRIGALTLILAAAFVFKYAADSGWIGPWARVFIGMGVGAVALAGGEWLVRKGHRVVAQGVAGLGIAILYFSLFASYSIFELLPQVAVFGMMAGITALGGWLAIRYESQALAILAMIGGFLTPVMLSTGENRPWALFIYLLILAGGGVFLAVRQRWQVLAWVAYLGTKILYWGSLIEDSGDTVGHPGLVFGVVYYVLFLLTPWRGIAAVAQISFGFAVLTANAFEAVSVWTWQLLAPLGIGIAVASYRRRTVEAVAAIVTAHGLAGFGLLMMMEGSPDVIIPRSATGFGVLLAIWAAAAAWVAVGWLQLPKRSAESAAALFALNSVAFAGEGLLLIQLSEWDLPAAFAFALALVHLAAALPALSGLGEGEEFGAVRRVSTILGVLFLACAFPLQFEGAVVSVLWAGLGGALAWLAAEDRAIWKQVSAWLLFAAALLRLIAVDLPDVSNAARAFANPVFFTAVLVAAAMFFAAWAWRKQASGGAMVFAGHATLLLTLVVEALRWADQATGMRDFLLYATTAVSLIVGVYAAVMVAIGVGIRSRAHRIGGLALLLIVVAKLYLFDVWLLDTLFRIVAFGALGSMLLATSFLYSRLKNTVKELLRDEGSTERPEPPPLAPSSPPAPKASFSAMPLPSMPPPPPAAPPAPPAL